MPLKKLIQPGEKVPLKLTAAQRTLVLEGLTCLDPGHEAAIRDTPADKPVMMTLDDLEDFGGYVAAEANHTEDGKLQRKLDTIFSKVQRLLARYTDEDEDEALVIEPAKSEIGRVVALALAGGEPESERPRRSAPLKLHQPDQVKARLYTLEVFLLSGPYSESFAKNNRVVSRTIQIRSDQTLEELHHAIFKAFDRFDEHMYEFQFGKGPMDPKGPTYVLPGAFEVDDSPRIAGRVDQTTIDSLRLKVGHPFGYWFDFGDDWWHQIDVVAIEDEIPKGKFPKVTKRVGKSPPQYAEEDE